MRILLTGATGQIGQAMIGLVSEDHTIVAAVHEAPLDYPETVPLDLVEPGAINEAVDEADPDWIINTAATSGVDACEEDPEHAHTVNAEAAGHLARAAVDHGARLLHVSTDYVFDGENAPYREDDPTGPVNAYGRSKLAGEQAARDVLGGQALIARTCVVFGPHKPNFVTWCIDQLTVEAEITIAEDQTITPTYARDLADQLLALVEADATGTYHTAGATRLSRLEMAQAIAEVFDLDPDPIVPCKRSDLPWDAQRPRDTSLVTEKISGLSPPWTFTEALEDLKRWRQDRPARPANDSDPSSIETEA